MEEFAAAFRRRRETGESFGGPNRRRRDNATEFCRVEFASRRLRFRPIPLLFLCVETRTRDTRGKDRVVREKRCCDFFATASGLSGSVKKDEREDDAAGYATAEERRHKFDSVLLRCTRVSAVHTYTRLIYAHCRKTRTPVRTRTRTAIGRPAVRIRPRLTPLLTDPLADADSAMLYGQRRSQLRRGI